MRKQQETYLRKDSQNRSRSKEIKSLDRKELKKVEKKLQTQEDVIIQLA